MPRSRAALALLACAVLLPARAQGSTAAQPERNGRIAYAHVGTDGDLFQIRIATAAGTRRQSLTTSRRFSSFTPSYSPNGKRIVFVRAYEQSDLWTMNADGTHERRLTWTKKIGEVAPAWSPDGKQIAFAVPSPLPSPAPAHAGRRHPSVLVAERELDRIRALRRQLSQLYIAAPTAAGGAPSRTPATGAQL